MAKHTVITFLFLATSTFAWSQKYSLEKSTVSFFSKAAIEDIAAENTKTSSIFNISNGDIAFSIPINEFVFSKSLMQEHFNEKYMESDKFPKSTFLGKVDGFVTDASGVQSVIARGKLTIHGKTRDVEIPGTIETVGSALVVKSKFTVRLEDYKIKIPQLMWQNIAEQVDVTVEFTYKLP